MRRILCLYFPEWPIQRLLAEHEVGRASGRPYILHARDPRRGELVVACNSPARERGVALGMPLAEAAALAGHASHPSEARVHILPHDPEADLAALARLAERCERFSPLVGWETVEGQVSGSKSERSEVRDQKSFSGPDCLFLDITGIGILFGGEESLAREAIADLARLGYDARGAIADTIGAAWAAARQGFKFHVSSFKLDDHGSALTWNRPASRVPQLGTWNLEALRLPQETIDLLAQLGVIQIEQLLALPRTSLRARFGEQLILRIDQLLGAAQETIVAHHPPPRFADEWILEYPAEQRETIEQVVRELLRRVARALANRREGAVQLSCRLDCAPGRPIFLEIGLFRPSADPEHLIELVRMQLEQASLPGPVGRVTVEARLTAPLENRQGELFAGGEHEASRQLALLIDRASSRLGRQAVLRPKLTADPLPERAVRYVSGVKGRKPGVSRTPHSALERPLTLHSPPLALEVVSLAPDGPPARFNLHDQVHQVARSWGPERIEAGWWRGRSVRRDYWRVETDSGQRFWLFRRLTDGKWHLHGEFA
jgi:protein ImuB